MDSLDLTALDTLIARQSGWGNTPSHLDCRAAHAAILFVWKKLQQIATERDVSSRLWPLWKMNSRAGQTRRVRQASLCQS